jgi:hypothetical protein
MATTMDEKLYRQIRALGVRKGHAHAVAEAVRKSPKSAPKAARRVAGDLTGAVLEIQDRLNHGPEKRTAAAKKAAATRSERRSAGHLQMAELSITERI